MEKTSNKKDELDYFNQYFNKLSINEKKINNKISNDLENNDTFEIDNSRPNTTLSSYASNLKTKIDDKNKNIKNKFDDYCPNYVKNSYGNKYFYSNYNYYDYNNTKNNESNKYNSSNIVKNIEYTEVNNNISKFNNYSETKTSQFTKNKNKIIENTKTYSTIIVNNEANDIPNISKTKKETNCTYQQQKMELLHVDIFNFSRQFFDCNNHWNISKAERKVKKFVERCRNSGYEPIVFIDGCNISQEAQNKWKQRRERDVKSGKRNVPQNLNLLFYELFNENNVKVHFSYEADNDDTLAAYASENKGYVLSQDRDFLRYYDYKYFIYTNFFYKKNNKIYFEHQMHLYPKQGVEYRELQVNPLPKTTEKWEEFMIHETEDPDALLYRRGAPTALVKIFGNPHVNVLRLRRALYFVLGIQKKIVENFPHWNFAKNEFEWYKQNTTADDTYREMLYKPFETVEFFFKDVKKPVEVSKLDWHNHLYALNLVVLELCCIAMKVPLISLLRQSKYYNKNPIV